MWIRVAFFSKKLLLHRIASASLEEEVLILDFEVFR